MPRIGNKKSRLGCVRCKLRKVKCGEQRPSCEWCTSHGLPCEYREWSKNKPRQQQIESKSPSVSDGESPVTIPGDDIQWRSLELALLQYYLVQISPSFPYLHSNKQEGLEVFQDLITQEALQCPCLLYAVYAFTLLYMHVEVSIHGRFPRNKNHFEAIGVRMRPEECQRSEYSRKNAKQAVDLLSLHRDYFDRALQEQQASIMKIDERNADGICMTSILIAFMSLVHVSQVEPHRISKPQYNMTLDWFYLQRSFDACWQAALPMLAQDSATIAILKTDPVIDTTILQPPSAHLPFWSLLTWEANASERQAAHEACIRPVAYLQELYMKVEQGEEWQTTARRILAFPGVVDVTFIKLLEECHPRALVVLAHVIALTKRMDDFWWVFQGVADYHVVDIAQLVPEEWQWAMNWPLRVVRAGLEVAGKPQ